MFFSFGCFLFIFGRLDFRGEGTDGGIPCTCSASLLAPSYTLAPRLISFWIFTIFMSSLYLHVYTHVPWPFSLMWIDLFESVPTHSCKLLSTKNSHFKSREVNVFADFFPIPSSCPSFSPYPTMSSVDVSHLRPSAGSRLPLRCCISFPCCNAHSSSVLHGIGPTKEHSPTLLQNDAPTWCCIE